VQTKYRRRARRARNAIASTISIMLTVSAGWLSTRLPRSLTGSALCSVIRLRTTVCTETTATLVSGRSGHTAGRPGSAVANHGGEPVGHRCGRRTGMHQHDRQPQRTSVDHAVPRGIGQQSARRSPCGSRRTSAGTLRVVIDPVGRKPPNTAIELGNIRRGGACCEPMPRGTA